MVAAAAAAAAAPQSSCEPGGVLLGCWGDSGDGAGTTCWVEVASWSCRARVARRQCAITWRWPLLGSVSWGLAPKGFGVVGQTRFSIPFPGERCPGDVPWVLLCFPGSEGLPPLGNAVVGEDASTQAWAEPCQTQLTNERCQSPVAAVPGRRFGLFCYRSSFLGCAKGQPGAALLFWEAPRPGRSFGARLLAGSTAASPRLGAEGRRRCGQTPLEAPCSSLCPSQTGERVAGWLQPAPKLGTVGCCCSVPALGCGVPCSNALGGTGLVLEGAIVPGWWPLSRRLCSPRRPGQPARQSLPAH